MCPNFALIYCDVNFGTSLRSKISQPRSRVTLSFTRGDQQGQAGIFTGHKKSHSQGRYCLFRWTTIIDDIQQYLSINSMQF